MIIMYWLGGGIGDQHVDHHSSCGRFASFEVSTAPPRAIYVHCHPFKDDFPVKNVQLYM